MVNLVYEVPTWESGGPPLVQVVVHGQLELPMSQHNFEYYCTYEMNSAAGLWFCSWILFHPWASPRTMWLKVVQLFVYWIVTGISRVLCFHNVRTTHVSRVNFIELSSVIALSIHSQYTHWRQYPVRCTIYLMYQKHQKSVWLCSRDIILWAVLFTYVPKISKASSPDSSLYSVELVHYTSRVRNSIQNSFRLGYTNL